MRRLVPVLLVVACTGDQQVTRNNASPTATITAPADGATVQENQPVVLRGSASDPDDDAATLTATWTLGDDVICQGAVGADGSTGCEVVLDAGSASITLEVHDPEGAAASDHVALTVAEGEPPIVTITAPADATIVREGDSIGFAGTAIDNRTLSSALIVAWSSDLDGVFDTTAPSTTGAVAADPVLSRGAHVVTLTATDEDGLSATASVDVSVNGVPTAPGVVILPASAGTNDDLVATIATASVDPDGDAVTYAYAWYENGALSSASANETVASSHTADKERWTVRVTPTDGKHEGPWAEATVTVGNSAPIVADATITPGTATEATTLTCVPGATTDADGTTTFTYAYAWDVDGADPGVTTATLTGAHFDKHDDVTCTIVASDGLSTSAPVTSAAVTIANTPPVVVSVVLSPSSPKTNDTIGATVVTSDVDGDAVTLTFTWTVDGGAAGTDTSSLSGATWFDRDELVAVAVVPNDGEDDGTGKGASATVANTAPGAPRVAITPAEPLEGYDKLVCAVATASTDDDGDGITYTGAWTVDGTAFTTPITTTWTGDSVAAASTAARESWTCTLTPSDGTATGPGGSDTVEILGDPVEYGHLQYPCSFAPAKGATVNFYGWVYVGGVTVGVGKGPGIDAELGIGPDGSDPETATGWTWYGSAYNADKDSPFEKLANDEYEATVAVPTVAGSYDFAWRFTTDGGLSWVYADLGGTYLSEGCGGAGTDDGYSAANAGQMTISP